MHNGLGHIDGRYRLGVEVQTKTSRRGFDAPAARREPGPHFLVGRPAEDVARRRHLDVPAGTEFQKSPIAVQRALRDLARSALSGLIVEQCFADRGRTRRAGSVPIGGWWTYLRQRPLCTRNGRWFFRFGHHGPYHPDDVYRVPVPTKVAELLNEIAVDGDDSELECPSVAAHVSRPLALPRRWRGRNYPYRHRQNRYTSIRRLILE